MTLVYFVSILPVTVGAFTSSLLGLYRWKSLDVAGKFLLLNCCLGCMTEIVSVYAAVRFRNNMPVYGIYSLIELMLVAAYFNFSINQLRKRALGLLIGMLGVAIGIINLFYFQPLRVFNSNFLYLEGVLIIGLSLFAFYRLIQLSEDLQLTKLRHFWLPFILCSFWTISFLNWGLHDYFAAHVHKLTWPINLSVNILSCCTYLAVALVFWKYPKLNPTHD